MPVSVVLPGRIYAGAAKNTGRVPHRQGMALYDPSNNAVKLKEYVLNGHPSGAEQTTIYTHNANGYTVEQVNTYSHQNIHKQAHSYDCK